MCTDAVAEMVEAARTGPRDRHLTNIEFRQCTAESLPFLGSSFDVVVSRMGAMFFADSAFSEIVRVTKPGGVLGFAVWHKSELNPFSSVITDVMSRHVETPPADPNAPGAFRFAELGKLAAVLTSAGAIHVRERIFTFDIAAPISPEEFWEMRSGTSETLRSKLAKLSNEENSQIADEVNRAVKEFFPNNQMRFPAQMLIVTASKPADDSSQA